MSKPSTPMVERKKPHLFQSLWVATCRYFYIDKEHFADRRKRAEAVVALSFMLVYATAWLSYVPLYGLILQNYIAAIAVGCIGLPTALGALFIQRRTKNLAAASALLNYGCVITLIGCIFATGGTWSPIFFWSFSPVAGAYLLSGSKHGMIVTAIAALGNGGVAYLTRPHENKEQWFLQFDLFSGFHVGFFALTVFLSMTIFSLIIYPFQSKLTETLQESENAREEAERQTKRAEQAFEKIKEQMAENRAIMNATEVAMVMIFPGMALDPQKSSAYFQKLFPGLSNFSQVLLKMRLESAKDLVQSVIGESDLTWSANEGAFPLEAEIDGNIHELEWKKIESDGIVTAIVFAAKNVQPLLDSKRKMESINRFAKLMVTVVGEQDQGQHQDQERKNRRVMKAVNRQIPQVKDAIARAEISLIDNWQPIYITLHTLKGEMSSFSFDDIREFLHRMEEHVKAVKDILRESKGKLERSQIAEIDKIKQTLTPELSELLQRLIEIQKICQQTGADQSAVLISRDKLLASKDDPQRLRDMIHGALFEDVRELIKGFEHEIYKVAGDLGKTSPRIVVKAAPFFLSDFAADKLRQTLTHIIRNSLDHGIEAREERLAKGKSEIGELTFIVEEADDAINLRIRDDGRGLNIEKIREKALAQGIITSQRNYPLQELAELILLPGFSTTSAVSMVSGRGIGMDAAQEFMRDMGGKLSIGLLDNSDNPALELKLTIPKSHVPVMAKEAWEGRLSA